MRYVLSVLVYVQRGDEVLVMRRNKEPNLGLWIAPGGKVEVGESPHETARREMLEETSLVVGDLRLRGFCTEVSPLPDWNWMLFIYTTRTFSGVVQPDLREGDFVWMPVSTYLNDLPIPQADMIFAPRVLQMDEGVFQAKFVYNEALKLVTWTEYPG
ncbi:MAG TPA: 8-oxo-dGTP diphosphatase [Anaerolineae bacterium]|nr:8-oxo-dGTP diphosphatase [Anaerolineae bacterium]HQI85060.1 8-oxo-dGTP diphosphatase [Anaerolineae bacterium]